MGAGDVHRPALQAQRAAGRAGPYAAALLVGLTSDDVQLRVGKAGDAAIGDRQPGHQVESFAILLHVGDIVGGPVEPFGQIGEFEPRAGGPVAARDHRQGRARRQVGGRARIEHAFGQAAAPQRLITLRRLNDDAAHRPGRDDRLLLRHLAGLAIGAAQGDAALEIGVDQSGGREEAGVAILFANAARHAGQDRGFGHQPFGDALEPDRRFALRQVHVANLGDERIAARPVAVDRPLCPARCAIDGDGYRIGARGNDRAGLNRQRDRPEEEEDQESRHAGAVPVSSANRR